MIDIILLLLAFVAGYVLAALTWARVRDVLANLLRQNVGLGALADSVSAIVRAAFDRVRR